MPLTQRASHLPIGVSLQHAFDQFAVSVERLVAKCRHRLVDSGNPQHFLEACLTAHDAPTAVGVDSRAAFAGDTMQSLLTFACVYGLA